MAGSTSIAAVAAAMRKGCRMVFLFGKSKRKRPRDDSRGRRGPTLNRRSAYHGPLVHCSEKPHPPLEVNGQVPYVQRMFT